MSFAVSSDSSLIRFVKKNKKIVYQDTITLEDCTFSSGSLMQLVFLLCFNVLSAAL